MPDKITVEELYRLVTDTREDIAGMRREAKEDRHEIKHDLTKLLTAHVKLEARVDHLETTVTDMEPQVDRMTQRAAFAAGAVAVGGFVLGWLREVFAHR